MFRRECGLLDGWITANENIVVLRDRFYLRRSISILMEAVFSRMTVSPYKRTRGVTDWFDEHESDANHILSGLSWLKIDL